MPGGPATAPGGDRPPAAPGAIPRKPPDLQRVPGEGGLHRLRPRSRDHSVARPMAALRGRTLPSRGLRRPRLPRCADLGNCPRSQRRAGGAARSHGDARRLHRRHRTTVGSLPAYSDGIPGHPTSFVAGALRRRMRGCGQQRSHLEAAELLA